MGMIRHPSWQSPSQRRETLLQLQQAVLTEYSKPDFQTKLRRVFSYECNDTEKKELDSELRELRQTIGARFGFENSPEGVEESAQMFTTEFYTDLEIMQNCNYINLLLHPELRDNLDEKVKTGKCTKEEKAFAKHIKRRLELGVKYDLREKAQKAILMKKQNKKPFIAEAGRYWRVVGGEKKGGIVVRTNEELQSAEMPERLATGSIVEEMELNGERLYYKLVSGKGPDLGWVSIMVKGATLLQPATADGVPNFEQAALTDKMPELEDGTTLTRKGLTSNTLCPTLDNMMETKVINMTKTPTLTRENVLKLQESLILEYSKPEVQAKLRTMFDDTCTNEEKQKLKQDLRVLRQEVGAKFGFEASPEGVEKSNKLIASTFANDYKIGKNARKINDLILGSPQVGQKISR